MGDKPTAEQRATDAALVALKAEYVATKERYEAALDDPTVIGFAFYSVETKYDQATHALVEALLPAYAALEAALAQREQREQLDDNTGIPF